MPFRGLTARRAAPLVSVKSRLIFLFLITNLIAGFTATGSNPVADMPSWIGGLPSGAPPLTLGKLRELKKAARPKGKDAKQ